MKRRTKLRLLELARVLVVLTPLVIVVILNRNDYFYSSAAAIKMTIGGCGVIVFAVLLSFDKVRIRSRALLFGVIFGFAYALEPLLADLKILSGAAFLGELINAIFFESRINRLRKLCDAEDAAEINAQAQEKVVEKIITGGRV
jgi:hypothetical protein